ncbi:hypothetical protein A9179_19710 [Pseudomonas alcaligenes]|uniref:Type II secretion system protein H n=2 Tax=Aquipseudomonas alcaligenes TaxID=43263 RepID=A0ABR7S705_AQUAC|nr:hypothetical protein [Pseudomonas alcaligenes]
MIVLSILAILAMLAVPSLGEIIRRNSIEAASNELYGLLQYARGEAVSRGQKVSISATASDAWTATLDVQAGSDGDSTTLRHYESLNQPQVVASTANTAVSALAFYANGTSSSATVITLCYSGDSTTTGKTISVARSGQISAPESVSCQ